MPKCQIPQVSAEMWCVWDVDSNSMVAGKLPNQRREVASLTKMMTFYTAYMLIQKVYADSSHIQIKVPAYCTQASGTSAELIADDVLSLD